MIFNKDQIAGLTRQLVTAGATYAAAKGWISADTAMVIVSAAVGLVSLTWEIYANSTAAKVETAVKVMSKPELAGPVVDRVVDAAKQQAENLLRRGVDRIDDIFTGKKG